MPVSMEQIERMHKERDKIEEVRPAQKNRRPAKGRMPEAQMTPAPPEDALPSASRRRALHEGNALTAQKELSLTDTVLPPAESPVVDLPAYRPEPPSKTMAVGQSAMRSILNPSLVRPLPIPVDPRKPQVTDHWEQMPDCREVSMVAPPTPPQKVPQLEKRKREAAPLTPPVLVGQQNLEDAPEGEDPFAGFPKEYQSAVEKIVQISDLLWSRNPAGAKSFAQYMITILRDMWAPDFDARTSSLVGPMLAKLCMDEKLAFPKWTEWNPAAQTLFVEALRENMGSDMVVDAVMGMARYGSRTPAAIPTQVLSQWMWLAILLSMAETFSTLETNNVEV